MRRAAAVLLLAVATTGAAAASPSTTPRLVVVAKQPLVVRGVHFRAREWVQLTAFADGQTLKRVRANRGGSFVAALPAIAYGRCAGLGIRAVGSLGSQAVFGLKLPLPGCLPVTAPARSP